MTVTDRPPYFELVRFLRVQRTMREQVMRTLSYIDVVAHARRAMAPALFSVALMDVTCPPSTVFGAYESNSAADKQMCVYPFNDHEGGQMEHEVVKLRWLQGLFAASDASLPATDLIGQR